MRKKTRCSSAAQSGGRKEYGTENVDGVGLQPNGRRHYGEGIKEEITQETTGRHIPSLGRTIHGKEGRGGGLASCK